LRIPLRTIVPPGGIEAEDTEIISNIPYRVQDMTDFGPEWSGGKQLFVNLVEEQEFELSLVGLMEEKYNIDLYFTKGPSYGKVKVFQGNRILGEFDGRNDEIFPGGMIQLKNIEVVYGDIKLKFKSSEIGADIGLDVFILSPVREYIPEWMILGPFINKRDSDVLRYGIDSIYPTEEKVNLSDSYIGVNGQEIKWTRYKTPENGYFSLWDKVEPYEFVITYAFTYVFAPDEVVVPFFIGSDDGSKVFLNGEELYRFLDIRVAAPDQDTIQLPLKKGWNELLLKIENNFGGYSFYSRIRDGNKNLQYSLVKPYTE
jgi:hypothetical protein